MKNFFICLLGVLMFHSCSDLEYDGSERALFTGKIVDENGNPISDVLVKAVAELNMDCYSCYDYETISYVRTDANGDFKLFFPNPTNETEMHLLVNHGDFGRAKIQSLSKVDFYNVQDANFQDYQIDFGNVEIYPTENFVMLSLSISDDVEFYITGWNLEGRVADKRVDYSPFYQNEYSNFFYDTQNLVAPNQIITLNYHYKNYNSDEIFENSVQIEINDQPVSYEINP